jgi:hypothetical protein
MRLLSARIESASQAENTKKSEWIFRKLKRAELSFAMQEQFNSRLRLPFSFTHYSYFPANFLRGLRRRALRIIKCGGGFNESQGAYVH